MENKLDYARPLDVWWWSTIPEIKGAADYLTDRIWKKDPPKFDKNRFKNHLKVVLTNLNVYRKLDKELYIALSMDKNNYFVPERFKNIFLKYEYVAYIIKYLTENGYTEYHQGVNFANFKRCSRIRSTSKLVRLFRKFRNIGGKTFRRTIPVLLKDDNKRLIGYDINLPDVKSYAQNLTKLNKCLARHDVNARVNQLDWPGFMKDYAKYEGNASYQRIFNNSSFEQGGRFYGHWSQNIESKYRKYITIDGERTVELDYSCLHISMLFGLENLIPPKGDLYQLKGIPAKFRPIIKLAVVIFLNATSETKAILALTNELRKLPPEQKIGCPKARDILEAIKNTYPELDKYFCSGYGVKLQFLDSKIAENILLNFAKDDIVCLSIHDSFIVTEEHKDRLECLMINNFKAMFGFEPSISAKQLSTCPFFE